MKKKLNLEAIPEGFDEDTQMDTEWACSIGSYGSRQLFIWVTYNGETYDVEVLADFTDVTSDFVKLVECKSLTSVKRWISTNYNHIISKWFTE